MSEEFRDRMRIVVDMMGGVGQLSKKSGVKALSLTPYLKKSMPGADKASAIAKAANISLDWLATGEGPMRRDEKNNNKELMEGGFTMVPRHQISASMGGGTIVHSEQIVDHLAFRTEWLNKIGADKSNMALIDAEGDSMEPTVKDGDMLLINISPVEIIKDGIYVLRVNGCLLAKRLQRSIDGGLRIISDNEAYTEEVIKPGELENVHIVGRVVWFGRGL